MTQQDSPTVLTVDDERDLADIYTHWLEAHGCHVKTAYQGAAALDLLSEDVDIVLLDRRMPGLSGDEVLQKIRDQGWDCRVAMITAVDPDFDVVEMGFDSYLVKPITREQLESMIDQLAGRSNWETKQQEYLALVEKQVALESHKSTTELEASQEYQNLQTQVAELESELDDDLDTFDDEDFAVAYRDLASGERTSPSSEEENSTE